MKTKKVVLGICAAAIVAVTTINVNLAMRGGLMSNLTLANIVSLAKGEYGTCNLCTQSYFDCLCSGGGGGWASQPADRDCGLYYFPSVGRWLPVFCQYDYCLTNNSGNCMPGYNCCP